MESEARTCIHCESLIPAGEIICPACGKEQVYGGNDELRTEDR